ncbi:MAG: dihydrolipoyl dehydrogenase [bacterium]
MEKVKLLIMGAGPAGYVGAIRAAQLGLKPVLLEKNHVGGTCLNRGCIPTKALIKAAHIMNDIKNSSIFGINSTSSFSWPDVTAHARRSVENNRKGIEFLLKKNGVRLVREKGKFIGEKHIEAGDLSFEAENIILATGSSPASLPHIKPDGKEIITSRHALFLEKLPASLTIVGGGVIGCEFAYIFNSFGVDVTIVEAMKNIIPSEDKDISKELQKSLKKQGISIYKKRMVQSVEKISENRLSVTLDNGKNFETEKLLSSTGRVPCTSSMNLEKTTIAVDKKGFIPVNSMNKTNVDGIYAVGDIIDSPMLAHTAEHEAVLAVEHIAGENPEKTNYNANPGCIYSEPEVASIGMTEQKVKDSGISYVTGKCPFKANGKAVASGDVRGFVKVIVEKESLKLLGAHIIGQSATDIIAEFLPAFSLSLNAKQNLELSISISTFCQTVSLCWFPDRF